MGSLVPICNIIMNAICVMHLAYYEEYEMPFGSVFTNNRTQAVRLPADTRFPAAVKKVLVRVVGKDRVLSPQGSTWDSFFCLKIVLVMTS